MIVRRYDDQRNRLETQHVITKVLRRHAQQQDQIPYKKELGGDTGLRLPNPLTLNEKMMTV